MLSTYFSIKSDIKKHLSYSDSCKKRFLGLFKPYIFFSIICFFLTSEPNLSIVKIVTRHFAGYGWAGQYYFIIMFQLVFVFPLLSRYKVNAVDVVFVFVIYFIGFYFLNQENPMSWFFLLGDRIFLYWLPYVLLGAYLAQNDSIWKKISSTIPVWIAVPILLICPFLIEEPIFLSSYIRPSVLLVSYITMLLSYTALKAASFGIILHLGRNSLIIFCYNSIVLSFVYKNLFIVNSLSQMTVSWRGITYLFIIFSVIVVCFILGKVIEFIGLKQIVSLT